MKYGSLKFCCVAAVILTSFSIWFNSGLNGFLVADVPSELVNILPVPMSAMNQPEGRQPLMAVWLEGYHLATCPRCYSAKNPTIFHLIYLHGHFTMAGNFNPYFL